MRKTRRRTVLPVLEKPRRLRVQWRRKRMKVRRRLLMLSRRNSPLLFHNHHLHLLRRLRRKQKNSWLVKTAKMREKHLMNCMEMTQKRWSRKQQRKKKRKHKLGMSWRKRCWRRWIFGITWPRKRSGTNRRSTSRQSSQWNRNCRHSKTILIRMRTYRELRPRLRRSCRSCRFRLSNLGSRLLARKMRSDITLRSSSTKKKRRKWR